MEDSVNKPNEEFKIKIDRLTKSAAYLGYCEEVYGYREYFFNMTDKQQIDYLLNSIPIAPEDTVMDLGCGSGSILNLIVKEYGCRGIGIDRLDSEILERNGKKFDYIKGDIDNVSDYAVKPSITLAVDSLYFSKNLDGLVRCLRGMKANQMYLFYSQYSFDDTVEDKSVLNCQNTKLAEALKKNNIPFETVDFSENERRLYDRSLEALPKFRAAFIHEDNRAFYEQKLKEDTFGEELYRKNSAARYLYIIDRPKS